MKKRAPHNRTLTCSPKEQTTLSKQLLTLSATQPLHMCIDKIIHQDLFTALPFLPTTFVDLLLLDPPYNLSKRFGQKTFRQQDAQAYTAWFAQLLQALLPTLKANATIYVCADWKTSMLIAPLLEQHFIIRNRITWEREKGRGARTNWKNNTEDIWFCTMGKDYTFHVDAVKLKRRVLAPYRDAAGKPKDWTQDEAGRFRLTHPSNIWTDISIPFWSMPENTDHPTQKPEKLIAKLLLASTNEGDLIFDPFLGSGTTAVVARKLNRHFVGIEREQLYCCFGQKRLQRAADDPRIQGYADGVFWERNAQPPHKA